MTVTIEWGWWLLPLAVTIWAAIIAYAYSIKDVGTGIGSAAGAFINLSLALAALAASLAAWLAWSLL